MDRSEWIEVLRRWQAQTCGCPIDRAKNHPAYSTMLEDADEILPLLFGRLVANTQNPRFYALLQDLTDADPVPEDAPESGFILRRHWLEWGADRGYVEYDVENDQAAGI